MNQRVRRPARPRSMPRCRTKWKRSSGSATCKSLVASVSASCVACSRLDAGSTERGEMMHRFRAGLGTAVALLLAVGCRGPFTGKSGRGLCEGTMAVTSKVEDEVVEFQAKNSCSLPQLLSFEILRPVNLAVDRAGPHLRVMPPGSTRSLATSSTTAISTSSSSPPISASTASRSTSTTRTPMG